ncbi:MAG TPA: DUF1801 domain-containing protein [Nocardiopsis listeri]|uniref:iron chaperone n=1 Tax=Nocardiopsis listeri TaxID=53440 RepID=UPI001D336D3D|nr:DUF1801 domain-containing protein [Nocardiopsis listeri]HJE57768.1 DUF1801 domain-containing protein [Nocardiopsis listeri]
MSSAENKDTTERGLSEWERAALKQRVAEKKKEARRGRGADKAAADARDVRDKIASMPESDRVLAERVHALVTTAAPDLAPKLWYGQPAYARKGKVVCYFRSGRMDKERYSTFGFSEQAALDDDSGLWPTAFALTELSEDAEKRLRALVEQAVS